MATVIESELTAERERVLDDLISETDHVAQETATYVDALSMKSPREPNNVKETQAIVQRIKTDLTDTIPYVRQLAGIEKKIDHDPDPDHQVKVVDDTKGAIPGIKQEKAEVVVQPIVEIKPVPSELITALEKLIASYSPFKKTKANIEKFNLACDKLVEKFNDEGNAGFSLFQSAVDGLLVEERHKNSRALRAASNYVTQNIAASISSLTLFTAKTQAQALIDLVNDPNDVFKKKIEAMEPQKRNERIEECSTELIQELKNADLEKGKAEQFVEAKRANLKSADLIKRMGNPNAPDKLAEFEEATAKLNKAEVSLDAAKNRLVAITLDPIKYLSMVDRVKAMKRLGYQTRDSVEYVNSVSEHIQRDIMSQPSLTKRTQIYERYVSTAEQLIKEKQFAAARLIFSTLDNAAQIARLKTTIAGTSDHAKKFMEYMTNLMSMSGNYKNLKSALNKVNKSSIKTVIPSDIVGKILEFTYPGGVPIGSDGKPDIKADNFVAELISYSKQTSLLTDKAKANSVLTAKIMQNKRDLRGESKESSEQLIAKYAKILSDKLQPISEKYEPRGSFKAEEIVLERINAKIEKTESNMDKLATAIKDLPPKLASSINTLQTRLSSFFSSITHKVQELQEKIKKMDSKVSPSTQSKSMDEADKSQKTVAEIRENKTETQRASVTSTHPSNEVQVHKEGELTQKTSEIDNKPIISDSDLNGQKALEAIKEIRNDAPEVSKTRPELLSHVEELLSNAQSVENGVLDLMRYNEQQLERVISAQSDADEVANTELKNEENRVALKKELKELIGSYSSIMKSNPDSKAFDVACTQLIEKYNDKNNSGFTLFQHAVDDLLVSGFHGYSRGLKAADKFVTSTIAGSLASLTLDAAKKQAQVLLDCVNDPSDIITKKIKELSPEMRNKRIEELRTQLEEQVQKFNADLESAEETVNLVKTQPKTTNFIDRLTELAETTSKLNQVRSNLNEVAQKLDALKQDPINLLIEIERNKKIGELKTELNSNIEALDSKRLEAERSLTLISKQIESDKLPENLTKNSNVSDRSAELKEATLKRDKAKDKFNAAKERMDILERDPIHYLNECERIKRIPQLAEQTQTTAQYYNLMIKYVAQDVLSQSSLLRVISTFERYVLIADQLVKDKQYAAALGIYSALNTAPISRLNLTTNGISKQAKKLFEDFDKLFLGGANSKNLRSAIDNANEISVKTPYLMNVFYSDLVSKCEYPDIQIDCDKKPNIRADEFFAKRINYCEQITKFVNNGKANSILTATIVQDLKGLNLASLGHRQKEIDSELDALSRKFKKPRSSASDTEAKKSLIEQVKITIDNTKIDMDNIAKSIKNFPPKLASSMTKLQTNLSSFFSSISLRVKEFQEKTQKMAPEASAPQNKTSDVVGQVQKPASQTLPPETAEKKAFMSATESRNEVQVKLKVELQEELTKKFKEGIPHQNNQEKIDEEKPSGEHL